MTGCLWDVLLVEGLPTMLRSCVQLLHWSATKDDDVLRKLGMCGAIKTALFECSEEQFIHLVDEAATIEQLNDQNILTLKQRYEVEIRAEQRERQMRMEIFE